jgi:hypothetical protein
MKWEFGMRKWEFGMRTWEFGMRKWEIGMRKWEFGSWKDRTKVRGIRLRNADFGLLIGKAEIFDRGVRNGSASGYNRLQSSLAKHIAIRG